MIITSIDYSLLDLQNFQKKKKIGISWNKSPTCNKIIILKFPTVEPKLNQRNNYILNVSYN